MLASARHVLAALAWLLAVIVIALGAAGLVTAMDGSSTGADRPELTAPGDSLVAPALDAQAAELRLLVDDVTALAGDARTALAALNGTDLDTVEASVAAGDVRIVAIRDRAAEIDAALAAVPLIGTPEAAYRVSAQLRARHAALEAALGATGQLEGAWVRLTSGSIAASRLSALLTAHVEAVGAAAEQGRDGDYDAAMTILDDADAAIAGARALRDRLAATVDVTVLDEWLDRSEAYDVALRALYLALRDVGGRVTDDVRAAIDAERAAKDRLPPDSRGLILIMAEIGRGGMNGAVIAIEEARGRLAAALDAVGAGADPGASPTASPAAAPPGSSGAASPTPREGGATLTPPP